MKILTYFWQEDIQLPEISPTTLLAANTDDCTGQNSSKLTAQAFPLIQDTEDNKTFGHISSTFVDSLRVN